MLMSGFMRAGQDCPIDFQTRCLDSLTTLLNIYFNALNLILSSVLNAASFSCLSYLVVNQD